MRRASNLCKRGVDMRRVFAIILTFILIPAASAEADIWDEGSQHDARKHEIYWPAQGEAYAAMPLEGVKIGIDPGHQSRGNNDREAIAPGSSETKPKVSTGTRGTTTGAAEYIVNLDVALKLRDALTALGAQVLMTRETHDIDISNQERAIMMNDWGADVVLRIHCNGSTDSRARGMGMYVRATGECAEESRALARALADAMVLTTGAELDGVFRRDTYTGLNWSLVPCVLVEMGFMTNPEEDILLSDSVYQDKLVMGMVNGIIDYLDGGQP